MFDSGGLSLIVTAIVACVLSVKIGLLSGNVKKMRTEIEDLRRKIGSG